MKIGSINFLIEFKTQDQTVPQEAYDHILNVYHNKCCGVLTITLDGSNLFLNKKLFSISFLLLRH